MSDGENDVFEPNRWVCDAETDPPDSRPFLDSEREIFKPQNPFFPLQFSKPAPSHPKDLETNRDTDNPWHRELVGENRNRRGERLSPAETALSGT